MAADLNASSSFLSERAAALGASQYPLIRSNTATGIINAARGRIICRQPKPFERMTAIGRGAPKAKKTREDLFGEGEKSEDGEDPMDIPAFFKRQVND